jgi:DNA transformation protein
MRPAFVDHCQELLATLGPVRSRRMFGGHGLYARDLFVALIAFDRLYLKVDATTEARFAAAGCEPFVYEGKGKPVRMSYWTVPAEAMESPVLMAPWARLAWQAAVAAAAKTAQKTAKKKTARKTTNEVVAGHAPGKPAAASRAALRGLRAKPRAPRRRRPATSGARRRRATGRLPGRRHALA